MMHLTFHEEAESEVDEVARYYESRSFGLGASFLDTIEKAIEEILARPTAYQLVSKDVRRKLLGRFPYSFLYVIEEDVIRVIAVAHQKRRPKYWSNRK
ncbi:MAG: type II toxin-antitoxin system RelE/ParE family toxin [Desulfobacterales bacterium]|jgi:toxin ParE1/3/4|nr:type II toxin-antitoxin system RelE/ParE family toxin [Desulfobacterales bacterium]